jgi:ribosomal protein L7/L12
VLHDLRWHGFSPVESIKITRAVLNVPLGEAKTIVHGSPAWADRRDEFEDVHEAAEAAAAEL